MGIFPDAHREFTNIVLKRLERTAPTRILHLPMFDNFDRKFRMLVGLYCEKRAYFPNQVIVREHHHADGMYIINMGEAALEKNEVLVKTFLSGMHFCSTVMLGISKKAPATLTA